MSISIHSLLNKIEKELNYAKQASDENTLKNHIYSIKTLCEVIMSEDSGRQSSIEIVNKGQATGTVAQVGKTEPLKTEDGANGESIFDF